MAYTINKTDGTIVATITDGTINTSTSLTLFGKSYSGFGEALNENLVKLLENQASTSTPTAPLTGEIWFDTNTSQLKVYDGSAFKPTGGAKSQAAEPSSASAGDFFHDTDLDQIYFYTGSAWQLLGPVFNSTQTLSGWLVETIASGGGDKTVSSMYAGNTRVAIVSKETFTPSVTQTGFASIKAGLTLNSTLGATFEGTTTSASAIDSTDTTNSASPSAAIQGGAHFLRSNQADTTTGAITIDADTGLIVGDAQEFSVTVSSNNVTLAQTSADKDFTITTNDSDGGGTKNTMVVTGATGAIAFTGNVSITGNLTVTGSYDTEASTTSTYTDTFIKVNSSNAEADAGLIVETSDASDARIFYEVATNRWMAGEGGNYSQVIRAADATTNGATSQSTVLTTDSSGGLTLASLALSAVGTISEGDTTNKNVPTIGAVVTFGDKWGGAAYTVSTSAPTSGDLVDGDFWFVRES
jgi:hypothetical protein